MGRLRFELRTNRLKAECSTAELATRRAWGTGTGGTAGADIRIAIQGCSEGITRRVALASVSQVAGAACLRQKEAGGELLDLWGRPELRLPGRPGLAGQGWVDVPAP